MSYLIVDPFSSGALYKEILDSNHEDYLQIQTYGSLLSGVPGKRVDGLLQFDQDFNNDIDFLYKWCKQNEVSTILTGTESGVWVAERLKSKLGLTTTSPNKLKARTHKGELLKILEESGLDVGFFKVITRSDKNIPKNIIEDLENGKRFVVKPATGAGSVDVRVISTLEDLRKSIENIFSKNGLFTEKTDVLIQEFHEGVEEIVDTVSINGEHNILSVCAYEKHQNSAGSFIYDRLKWLPENHHDVESLTRYSIDILNTLEFYNGSSHLEIIMTVKGPRLVDFGARPHGAGHPMRTFELTSDSQLHLEIEGNSSLQRRPKDYSIKRMGSIEFFSLERPKIAVGDFENIFKYNNDSIKELLINARQGVKYSETQNLLDSLELGLAFISDEDAEGVSETGRIIREMFLDNFKNIDKNDI